MNIPSNRQESLKQGLPYYFTGKPCIHGHLSKRDAKDRKCIECELIFVRKRIKHPVYKEKFLNWCHANKDKRRASSKKSRAKYPDKIKAAMSDWYERNKAYSSAKGRVWRLANRSKIYAANAARRAGELMATPPWAIPLFQKEFEAIYEERDCKTRETGIVHHVDHIYPLKGKESCGLHVPWNLRVIPARENLRKRNRPPKDIIMLQTESGLRFQSEGSRNSVVHAD